MRISKKLLPVPRGMAATAAILWFCLAAASAISAESDPDPWPRSSTKAISVLLGARQNAEAVTWARALVDTLNTQGAQGADLARGLEVLARSLRRSGQARQAETLIFARQAVAAGSAPPAAGPALQASCLNTLGLVLFQRSENEEALVAFEQATASWTISHGPNDQRVAAALNNQGLVLNAVGRNDQALLVLEKAAAIYRTRQDEPHYLIKLAGTTMSLAKLHLKLGHYELAGQHGELAVEIYRSLPGGDHPKLGSALGDLAALHRAMGDLDQAEELYLSALPLIETAHGPEYTEVGRILNNLGNLRADRGDIAAARSCFERSLAITEKAHGPDDPQTGLRLLNLGSTLADLGDFKAATVYLTRSEEIFEARLGPDHLYMGFAEQVLGSALAAMGETEAGLAHMLRAKVILENELGTTHLDVAEVLGDLGNILIDMDRQAEAGPHLARGLKIVRTELGPEHPQVTHLLHAQGRLSLREHDFSGAETVLAEAVQIGTGALGPEHPELAAIHLDLALALSELGQTSAAFEHALTAERIGRSHFALAAVAFEERRMLQFAGQRTAGLGLATALALELQQSGELQAEATLLWEELVRSRGLVLDLMGTRQRHQQHTPASRVLVDSLTAATSELACLFVRGISDDSPADHRAALTAVRNRREQLERRLATSSLTFARRMVVGKAGFGEVISSLQPDDMLVSYLTYARDDKAEARLAALIHRPDGSAPQLLSLGPAAAIDSAVRDWRQTILAGATATGEQLPQATADCLQAGRHLAELVWKPLDLPKGPGRVHIVPDGVLALVDFPALPRAEGGFLVENEMLLAMASAERDLLRRPDPATHRAGLLVMGGMEFGDGTREEKVLGELRDCRNYQDLRFEPLPGTLHETRTVADMWSGLNDAPVHRLVGTEADESQFKTMVADYAVVHLATHGFFLGGECRDPAAGTRGVGTLVPNLRRKNDSDPVHPLLLAGLAFSGANLKSETEATEDGILTAYEVTALDLSGVEVAILSACNTGQGEILEGEGVFGLQRAFAMAGTRSLIMSLWPVDDEIAAAWMEKLYRNHLQEGMDYPAAARQASLQMLLAQRARGWPEHPFIWSPFVRIRTGS